MKIGKLSLRPTRRGWTILALLALLASSYAADAVASVGRVRAGVRAGTLELGGRNREEALVALTERGELLLSKPVELYADTQDTRKLTVSPAQVGFSPDTETTFDDAYGVGRRGNLFVRMWHRVRALFTSTDVGWESNHDEKAAKDLVDTFATEIDTTGHEAGIEAEGTKIVPVGAVPGRQLDQDEAVRTIVEGLESWPRRSMELQISVKHRRTTIDDAREAADTANGWAKAPITLTAPDGSRHFIPRDQVAKMLEAVPRKRGLDWTLAVRFSPERVRAQLADDMKPFEREAKDASFAVSGTSASVVAGQNGRKFDVENTARALAEAAKRDEDRVAEAAFSDVAPKLTTETAQELKITELVSSFTTHHPCCQPRVANIHKMADTVDGAIIKPGASFSLNSYVGERTLEKGYVLAPMIFDGEFRDDVGGGVSQFATTFYNAIFFGGYRFGTHTAHSYYISRYPAGREATISWTRPDLSFTNDSSAGILVKTSYSTTSITVSFYGTKGGRVVSAEAGQRTNPTEPPEKREPVAGMPPGQERVKQEGAPGFDIVVVRIIRKDGDEKRERIFTRYKPTPRIIEYGPGTPTPTSSPGQPRKPGTTPTPAPEATEGPGGVPGGAGT